MVECFDVCCRYGDWYSTLEVGILENALEQVIFKQNLNVLGG